MWTTECRFRVISKGRVTCTTDIAYDAMKYAKDYSRYYRTPHIVEMKNNRNQFVEVGIFHRGKRLVSIDSVNNNF